MSRREFSGKVKEQAALRANGHCEQCTARLGPGNIEYDHIIPDQMGGEPTLENCKVLCRACHRAKTNRDVGVIAKAKRIRAKHLGIRKPSRFACSRDSRWKKKLDGTVVPR